MEASKKARVDESLIKAKMDMTFSLRRKEVVNKQPMVAELKDRWPALFFKGTLTFVAFENYSTFKSSRLPPMPHPLVPIRSVFFKKLYLHKQTYNHPGVFIFLKKLYLQADLKPTASAHAREFLFTKAMDSDIIYVLYICIIYIYIHIYIFQFNGYLHHLFALFF